MAESRWLDTIELTQKALALLALLEEVNPLQKSEVLVILNAMVQIETHRAVHASTKERRNA